MVEIRRCSVAEIESAPDLDEALAGYASESSLPEIGAACPQFDTYYKLEAAGMLHAVGAFVDGHLQGGILLLVTVLPHYGVPAATTESFFVVKEARRLGLGLQLLTHAEEIAREMGAKALLVSAPTGGSLARVMPAMGSYRHSNQVFVRAL